MRWWGLVVLALATYRAARIVAVDTISVPFRDRLYGWAWDDEHPEVDPHNPKQMRAGSRGLIRTWLYALFSCPLCIGVWLAAGFYSAWRWWDWAPVHAIIVVLAVAGAQCFLAVHDRADE